MFGGRSRYDYEEYLTQLADDLTPVLGGDLDCGGYNITNIEDLSLDGALTADDTTETHQIGNVTFNNNTISSATIIGNALTLESGWGNIVINDGWTASGQTCEDLGTVTTAVITNADINSGTMDNVTIGGSVAAAITGTTITASTKVVIPRGTEAAPSLALSTESGSGLYNASLANDDISISIKGSLVAGFGSTLVGIDFYQPLDMNDNDITGVEDLDADTVTIGTGNALYEFMDGYVSNILAVQCTQTNQHAHLMLYPKDDDGSKASSIWLHTIGTPTSNTNQQYLRLTSGTTASDASTIFTGSSGSGDTPYLQLRAGSQTNQIKCATDGGVLMQQLKSGTSQANAGAAQYELWVDTDDDNTVKWGT